MSIMSHALWPQLQKYFRIDRVRKSDSAKSRVRIEIDDLPPSLEVHALHMTMGCVECGRPIHPIRARKAPSKRSQARGLYYAATCPLTVRIGCSRGAAAKDEYVLIRTFFNS